MIKEHFLQLDPRAQLAVLPALQGSLRDGDVANFFLRELSDYLISALSEGFTPLCSFVERCGVEASPRVNSFFVQALPAIISSFDSARNPPILFRLLDLCFDHVLHFRDDFWKAGGLEMMCDFLVRFPSFSRNVIVLFEKCLPGRNPGLVCALREVGLLPLLYSYFPVRTIDPIVHSFFWWCETHS